MSAQKLRASLRSRSGAILRITAVDDAVTGVCVSAQKLRASVRSRRGAILAITASTTPSPASV